MGPERFVIDSVVRIWEPAFGCCSGLPCPGTYTSMLYAPYGQKTYLLFLGGSVLNP